MNEWNCRSKKRSDLFECYLQGQNWTCRISLVRDASDTDQSHVPVFTVSIVSTEDTRHSPSTSCAARPVPVTLAKGWVEDHAHCRSCLLHNVYRLAWFAFPWCCCARVENRISGFIYLIFFFSDATHLEVSHGFHAAKAQVKSREILELLGKS